MERIDEHSLPEIIDGIALEHKHCYLHAALYAQGKDILDVASGEGYGTALLANTAKSVVGLALSPENVTHAQATYVAENLQYKQGDAFAIPLPDASVDLVVSIAACKLHEPQEKMFLEIKRVLRPNGILYISAQTHCVSPGSEKGETAGERPEKTLASLLAPHFASHKTIGQRLAYGSVIAASEGTAHFVAWHAGSPIQTPVAGLPRATYLAAIASNGELPESFSGVLETRVEDSAPYKSLLEKMRSLQDELNLAKNDVQMLKSENKSKENHLYELEYFISTLLTSRSWRITKPLRFIATCARKGKKLVQAYRTKTAAPEAAPALKEPTATFVQECVAAHKLGNPVPVADVTAIRIHVAAKGNLFFQEIAQLIHGGFTDIGKQASIVVSETFADCADAAHSDAGLHLIIAPHEFFHFIPQAAQWPHTKGLLWILNTEQAHTSWFAAARESFTKADLVLDMDQELATRLAAEGFRTEHLPLGFSAHCHLFDGVAPLALNDATVGIPKRIRAWPVPAGVLDAPLHERPLDYCFFGASTERRNAFFARNAALFARLEGYLRLKPLTGPILAGENSQLSTEETCSIIRRSKISLNIHQSAHSYFEWHRIVLQGMWQGALVLSEPCTPALPFRPNIEYVSVDLDNLADTLEYLLLSDAGKAFAERVRQQAYTTLTERCHVGSRLQELLQLYPRVNISGSRK